MNVPENLRSFIQKLLEGSVLGLRHFQKLHFAAFDVHSSVIPNHALIGRKFPSFGNTEEGIPARITELVILCGIAFMGSLALGAHVDHGILLEWLYKSENNVKRVLLVLNVIQKIKCRPEQKPE